MMNVDLKRGFTLGDWEVQPLRGRIVGPGGTIHLEPKIMEVLVVLAGRPGEVIERSDLVHEVWGKRAVTDEPLTRCIAELRRMLNDSREKPEYIQTIPKRGYRLVAPVSARATATAEMAANQASAAAAATQIAPPSSRLYRLIRELRRRKVFRMAAAYAVTSWIMLQLADVVFEPMEIPIWVMNTLILAVIFGFPLALLCAWLFEVTPSGIKFDVRGEHRKPGTVGSTEMITVGGFILVAILFVTLSARIVLRQTSDEELSEIVTQAPQLLSIAVLPFANLSDESENEYFSDGLSEEIMNRLASVNGLSVVARTSSFSFKGSNKDAKTIANELKVSYLLDGSVRKDGDRIRISAQLVNSDGYRLWSKSYEGVLDNVFSLQDTIANDIVTEVRPALPVGDSKAPIRTEPPTENMSAYELVLRGRFHLQRRNEGPLKRSASLFGRAIELDGHYGDAYVALATANALLPFYSYEPVDEAFDLAMTTIERGAQKDPSVDTKAAGIMAFMLFYSEWRWIESEIGFRRALDYSPKDAELLQWYSHFLASVGRSEEALDYAIRAKELDRLSPVVNQRLAITYMWANQNELARQHFELAAELGMAPTANPEAYVILLTRLGKYDEVRSLMIGLQKMLGHATDWVDPVLTAIQTPEARPAAIEAVVRAERNNNISKQHLYGAWIYLGETDRALDVALQLIHDRPGFNAEFLFAAETQELRTNPRFAELIRAIELHRYWENFGWPEACRADGEQIVCH